MTCLICQQPTNDKKQFTDLLVLKKPEQLTCSTCLQTFETISDKHCPTCFKNHEPKRCKDCQQWKMKGNSVKHQSIFTYNQAMKDYFSLFKFQGDYLLAKPFALAIQRTLLPYRDYVIVPIPLSHQKLKTRRFNQVEALLDAAKIPYTSLLEKEDTQAQSSKSKQERLQTQQVFTVKTVTEFPEKVLIVDDIYTTGQTIYLAKKVLQEHGVKEIISFSLAR